MRFDLQIDQTPAGCTQSLDADGNLVTVAWFNDIHERMVICATSEVETMRDNPYDFLVTPSMVAFQSATNREKLRSSVRA